MFWSRWLAAVEVLGGGYQFRERKDLLMIWMWNMRQSGIKDDFNV